jgi:hypothetical protein
MSFHPRTSLIAVCTGLVLATSALLTGCSSDGTVTSNGSSLVLGNWQFSSTASTASKLPLLSGALSGSSTAPSGIFHTDSSSACVDPTTDIELTGSVSTTGSASVTTLTGALAGGTLTITGTLASNGKSLTNATYNVTGGTCALSAAVPATAQAYSSITGNYTGTFSDPDGAVIAISSTLTQTPASDSNGNFQLSGSATFPSNPCFNSPVTVSNTQVTGGSFTLTYADPTTQNSVVASGTFSTDGTTLTVTNWNLTGSCGPDTGTGLLTKQ